MKAIEPVTWETVRNPKSNGGSHCGKEREKAHRK